MQLNDGTFKGRFDITSPSYAVVKGGTYTTDPTTYLAEGYKAVENNGTWTVQVKTVARIGNVEYTTLESAAEAAKSGETIVLLADIDLSNHARSASDDIILTGVTLDLNGKTVRGFNSGVRYSGTGAVIKNGTFDFVEAEAKPNYGLSIGSYNSKNHDTDFKLQDLTVKGGINIDYADVTLDNVNIDMGASAFYAIWVDEDGASATYNSGAITASTSATAVFGVAKGLNGAADGSISVTGGKILTNGKNLRLGGNYLPVEVSGGVFDAAVPEDCCAEGYIPTANIDEETKATYPYTVKQGAFVARIGDKKYETLADAITDATDGANTITLLADINLGSDYANINKAVTIEGDGHTITSSAAQAVMLSGNGAVTISNTKITATNGHGIQAGNDNAAYSGALTLNEGSVLTVAKRGIRIYKEDTGLAITVEGSTIQSNKQDPKTTYTTGDEAMGLSLGTTDGKGYDVTINNSIIQGFSYDISVVTSGSNLNVNMTGGETYGRAILNVWGDNNNFNLNGVTVHGLNNETGPQEAYSCIVENNLNGVVAENNTYTIQDCQFIATLSEAAMTTSGSSATEQMIGLRGTNATVKVLGSTTYTCNSEERGGFITDEGELFANKLYFDDATKETFANAFKEAVIADEKEAEVNLYPVTWTPEVFYYWPDGKGGNEGVYCKFTDPFENTQNYILGDGESIQLQKNITFDHNIVNPLASGTINILFGENTIAKGEYSLMLKEGQSVNTDKQTDIFSAVDEGYKVVETAVEGGYTYTVVAKEYVAKIGEEQYYSLAEAFEAAQAGQTITVLTDIDLPSTIAVTKQVTLDLDGKKIFNTSDLWVGGNWSFFSVQANGNLTVTGNGTIDAKENDCYTFDVQDGGVLTIKDGTFTGNISCVYLLNQAGTGVSTCNIEGGTFSIKQLAPDVQDDKYRYLLNCLDASYASNTVKFNVTGGSYVNFNPANNQAEGVETNFCAAGYEAVQNGDVWTVQKAPVAKIGETTYTSLAEAFEDAQDGQTITVLTDIDLPSTIVVGKQVTLDLAGKTISNTSDLWGGDNWSFFSVRANGNLTVTGNGTIDAKENDCYTFDVRNGGILTIKNGTFTGNISCVYLINEAGTGVSTCNIEGGRFSIKQLANNVQDDKYRYLLNCHDASYASNTAKFNVTGGSFVKFNPANNQAEGTETNFCAAGYEAVQDGDVWTVQKAPVAQIEGGAKYETLQAAINACEAGTETTIKLLDNVTDGAGFAIPDGVTNKNIIIDFDGKSYNVTKDAVGSGKTKTQAMHFYSGNTLTLKNGTITSAATSEENKLKMMMQNYCDLTLDGMTIDCSNVNGGTYPDYSGTAYEYWSNKSIPVFNFNTGNATIKNTTITFRDGDNMGLCVDGGTVALGEGTVVNGPVSAVTGTVTITGGKYSGAVTSDQATLKISGGIFTIEPAAEYCAEGFISVDNEDEATKAQYPYTVVNDDEYVFELIDQEVYELETAKTFKHVTYTRTFNNVNWQSLFVPFDINVEDYAGKYEFAKIHMIALEKDDEGFTSSSKIVVSYTKVTSGTLYANKPYLIKAKTKGTDIFELENVTLKGCNDINPIECNTTHADYSIVGSYQPVTATTENPYMAMAGGTINWYQSSTISPFRWVIRVSPKADDYARPSIELVEDDDITGISTMFLNNDDIEGFYNVNGVRHDTPVKGINIVRYKNGQTKKVVIK